MERKQTQLQPTLHGRAGEGCKGFAKKLKTERGTPGCLMGRDFPQEAPIALNRPFSQGAWGARTGNERLLSPGSGDQPVNCVKPRSRRIFPLEFQTDSTSRLLGEKPGSMSQDSGTTGKVQFPS